MSAVGIIPARYAAKRFPGKVLAPIAGVPMLRRVFEGALRAKRLREVVVAADDERIARACASFGARVVLTSPDHATGTERVAEVARGLEDDVVVNIQGDEPLIEGFAIDAAIEALLECDAADMATLAHDAEPGAESDPHRVKVELDRGGFALRFSRSPVPASSDGREPPRTLQHVGLYAYRRTFLLELVTWPATAGEQAEGLEQLRALERGRRIRVAVLEGYRSLPVDVPSDVARVESELANRPSSLPLRKGGA